MISKYFFMKALGIDYGEKKIGLSISVGSIALPWKILNNFKSNNEVIDEIKKIIDQEKIEVIVVGKPLSLRGTGSNQTKVVNDFVDFIKKNVNLPVYEIDERFSSQMAQKQSIGKNDDAQAAANILQTYLDKI